MNVSQIDVLWQHPCQDDSHIYKVIKRHLSSPDIRSFRAAVAYVSWGGLSLLAEALEAFLKSGRSMETVYGIQNGVTTPDALLYSIYLRRRYDSYAEAKSYSWDYGDSEFHPKYFEFGYGDHAVCIAGSGNLTGGGLACNHELGTSLTLPTDSKTYVAYRQWWDYYMNGGKSITPQTVREVTRQGQMGDERKARSNREGAPRLGLQLPRAAKPLFQHILDETEQRAVKHDMLADADALTEKPKRLYLQILNETGGGHQIQLPVATLGAFFGVGAGESKQVEFVFPDLSDSVNVHLTHFPNNTHRVRLRPLKRVERPAIIVFYQTEDGSSYECRVVPREDYSTLLIQTCKEQTRKDSRYWGLGD